MPTMPKPAAVDRLTQAIKMARADDLAEIYNELFPTEPTTEGKARADRAALVNKIVAHISSGLEVEEILSLWNVVFPTERKVWFDEEEGVVHYVTKAQPVGHAD